MAQRRQQQPSNVYGRILGQGQTDMNQFLQQLMMMHAYRDREQDSEQAQLQRLGVQRRQALTDQQTQTDLTKAGWDFQKQAAQEREAVDRRQALADQYRTDVLGIRRNPLLSPEVQQIEGDYLAGTYGGMPGAKKVQFDPTLAVSPEGSPWRTASAVQTIAGMDPSKFVGDPTAALAQVGRTHFLGDLSVPVAGPVELGGLPPRAETAAGQAVGDAWTDALEGHRGAKLIEIETAGDLAGARAREQFPTSALLMQMQQLGNERAARAGAGRRASSAKPGMEVVIGLGENPALAPSVNPNVPFDPDALVGYYVALPDGTMLHIEPGFEGVFHTTGETVTGGTPYDGYPYVYSMPISSTEVGKVREVAIEFAKGAEGFAPAVGESGFKVAPSALAAGEDPVAGQHGDLMLTGIPLPGIGSWDALLNDFEMQSMEQYFKDLPRLPPGPGARGYMVGTTR